MTYIISKTFVCVSLMYLDRNIESYMRIFVLFRNIVIYDKYIKINILFINIIKILFSSVSYIFVTCGNM